MNAPFSWNAGIAKMRCRTSSSLDPDAEPLGFGERGALVDHLLQDLLLDAELLEQLVVHVAAVRGAVRLQLRLVGPPEFAGGDFAGPRRWRRCRRRRRRRRCRAGNRECRR